jgi:hypothetical protein
MYPINLVIPMRPRNENTFLNPCDWSQSDKESFLDLIESMGTNTTWKVSAIRERLERYPCPIGVTNDGKSISLYGEPVRLVAPDYGNPGIYAPDILDIIIRICNFDEKITSETTGSGFYLRDILTQVAVKWGVDRSYV